jgi:hypothetical protein
VSSFLHYTITDHTGYPVPSVKGFMKKLYLREGRKQYYYDFPNNNDPLTEFAFKLIHLKLPLHHRVHQFNASFPDKCPFHSNDVENWAHFFNAPPLIPLPHCSLNYMLMSGSHRL